MQERETMFDTDKLTQDEILKYGLQDRVKPSLNPDVGKTKRKQAERDADAVKRLEDRFNALPVYMQNRIRRNK